ncbi:MAG: chromate transporter [Sarcina sp.]
MEKLETKVQIDRNIRNWTILWQLFKSTFMISACTFGGGFVIVSLMKKKFVEDLGWIEENEMLDIAAISQSSPGPIPINASVILGYRMQGILGAFIAVLGTAIPPIVIISTISVFYTQFRESKIVSTALMVMRAGVAAVIFDVVIKLAKNVIATKSKLYIFLMIFTFILTYFIGMSAILVILMCLAVGIITLIAEIKKEKADKEES